MDQKPAFLVMVTTNYSGNGRLLRWDAPVQGFLGYRLLGRYACYPVAPRWDGGALVEPTVELTVPHAQELLEAFIGGAVRNEAVQQLADAIAKVKP